MKRMVVILALYSAFITYQWCRLATYMERGNAALQQSTDEIIRLKVKHEGWEWVDGAPRPIMPRPKREG